MQFIYLKHFEGTVYFLKDRPATLYNVFNHSSCVIIIIIWYHDCNTTVSQSKNTLHVYVSFTAH